MKINSLFALAFVLVSILTTPGCKKNEGNFITSQATKIDSILNGDASFHFIYDSLDRVIETVYQIGDTLQERNMYHYQSQEVVPFERLHFFRTSVTPDYVSKYSYGNNNKKTYDSTYSIAGTNYCVVRINYDLANKICALQDLSFDAGGVRIHNWETDTIFLNSNSNIDSVRSYTGASQTDYGSWNFWVTRIYEQYDNNENLFSGLSISNCLTYQASDINWGQPSGGGNSAYHFLDVINRNNFTVFKIVYPSPNTNYNIVNSRSLNFDANNVRVAETFSTGFSANNYTFIYN